MLNRNLSLLAGKGWLVSIFFPTTSIESTSIFLYAMNHRRSWVSLFFFIENLLSNYIFPYFTFYYALLVHRVLEKN